MTDYSCIHKNRYYRDGHKGKEVIGGIIPGAITWIETWCADCGRCIKLVRTDERDDSSYDAMWRAL